MGGSYLSIIFTVALLFSATTLGAPPPECFEVLSDVRLLKNKVYFEVKEDNKQGSTDVNNAFIANSKDKILGELQFRYDSKSADLHIFDVRIKKKYKGQGLSRLLLAYVVGLNPDVQTVTSELNSKNEALFNRQLLDGKTIKGAIKKTRAYKKVAAIGFGKIKWVDWDDEEGFPLFRGKIDTK